MPLASAPTTKAIAVMAVIFASGVVTGVLVSRVTDLFEAQRGTQFRIETTMQDLAEHLSLNPSQVEDIHAILDDLIMEEAELLGELKWNQMEAHERIVRYLTPEQARRFSDLIRVSGDAR